MSKPDESLLEIVLKSEPEPEPEPLLDVVGSKEIRPEVRPEATPEPKEPESSLGSVFSSPTLVDSLRAFVIKFHPEVAELTQDMKDKFQIVVSTETLCMLNYILNNYPEDITSIHTQLNAILDDGKINISDVPLIIKLISSIYNLILQKKDEIIKDPVNECSVILKMTFYVLIKTENIAIGKMSQEESIITFNNIIDSCLFIVKTSPQAPQIAKDFKYRCVKLFACFA